MFKWIKRFSDWLFNTRPLRRASCILLFGHDLDDTRGQDIQDVLKYWEYQENPEDPELKAFAEQYEKELAREEFIHFLKVFATLVFNLVLFWLFWHFLIEAPGV